MCLLRQHVFQYSVLIALILVSPATAVHAAGDKVEYARDVLPILASTCFNCHGPDPATRKAGFRLDEQSASRTETKTGAIGIVPGKPNESEIVLRILTEDDDEIMPPRKSNLKLTAAQKETIRKWVEQGGDYETHWAYQPIRQPPVPQLKGVERVDHPIDRFLLSRLQSAGLTPSPQADRYTLARRLSLDLTGLAPSLEMADRFAKDTRPDAYERLVDELLASPAYGENFAATWLDLARYADSNGYAEDRLRTIWRYRDWVIAAINQNKPFDQFTIEQLAGDLLPDATQEQILATAFHRNTLTNTEGGTNDEEFRTAAVVDRVNTTMQVWMGVTAACAQCHDHKYDPFSQEEYFNLYAIFNQTADADRADNSPLLEEIMPAEQAKRDALAAQIAELEKVIVVKLKEQREAQAKEAEAFKPGDGPLTARFVRVENLEKAGFVHVAEVQVFSGDQNVALKGKASQISTDFGGEAARAIDGNTDGDYLKNSVSHTGAADNAWWEVDLGSAVPVQKIVVWNRTDNGLESRLTDWRLIAFDEQRRPIWIQTFNQPAKPSATAQLPADAKELTKDTLAQLANYGKATTAAPKVPEQEQLEKLKKQFASITGIKTPIVRELPASARRKTHIMLRGEFMSLGKEVGPGTPSIFPPLPSNVPADRLALARWLVSPENPLTARVAVNRYWEQLMGTGLVETPEDFGLRGGLPHHPQLLDWMAAQFMSQGWDVKKLIKLIVTSAAYKQASNVTTEQLERDADNRFFARGPRQRLTAEMVRDQALAVSGLLTHEIGGPSVRPPRPKLGLSAAFGASTDWTDSTGDDRHRRGLYTEWRRSAPYPSMVTFDATPRTVCTIRRPRTNTPLQALVTMNDPVYVEAAQALARRMIKEGGDTVASRAAYGLRLAVTRPPTAAEVDRLIKLFESAKAGYADKANDARIFATDPIGPLPEGVDPIDAAAWTLVGNVLLNLDETLSKR